MSTGRNVTREVRKDMADRDKRIQEKRLPYTGQARCVWDLSADHSV